MKYQIREIYDFNEIECNDIPKNIHIIWKSKQDSDVPEYLVKQVENWLGVLDSSWTVYLWNNNTLETLKNNSDEFGKQIFEIAEKQNELSAYADIVRYYIIWKFGGYYFDADFEVYNSIDPLTHVDSDFIICNDTEAYYPYITNSFFGAKKELQFMKQLLDSLIEKHKNPEYYNEWIMRRTGPIFMGNEMINYEGFEKSIAKIPMLYFYRNNVGDQLIDRDENEQIVIHTNEKIFEQRFARHDYRSTHNNVKLKKEKYKKQNLVDTNVEFLFTKYINDPYICAKAHDIGDYTYGRPRVTYYEGYKGHVTIGKFCSISANVEIMVNGFHNIDCVSAYPFSILSLRDDINEFVDFDFDEVSIPYSKDVIIGNDVYIGENSVIMGGLKIGDGAIIAANSVVTHNVMPYEIVGGNPAKHIRYRFNEKQIEKLMHIAWWNWDIGKIKENILYITSPNIDEFIKRFDV